MFEYKYTQRQRQSRNRVLSDPRDLLDILQFTPKDREDSDSENGTANAPSDQLPVISFGYTYSPSDRGIALVVVTAQFLPKLLGESFNGQRPEMISWFLEIVHENMWWDRQFARVRRAWLVGVVAVEHFFPGRY